MGIRLLVCLVACLMPVQWGWTEGHGPVFALATPTLGQGGVSIDTVLMSLRSDAARAPVSLGLMLGYGVTEDLQVNVKMPFARTGGRALQSMHGGMPNMRAGMMGAPRDVEGGLMWRFHREAQDVGVRRESTLHLNLGSPTEHRRRGLRASESFHAALATGYASREHYWWLAGGVQTYRVRGDDRLGDLRYASAVYGYRPARFRPDHAPLDLRWFVEALAEFPRADRESGQHLADTGGRRVLAGPSFLALSGPWGVSGGVLFPLHEDLKAAEFTERYRVKLVVTYWY